MAFWFIVLFTEGHNLELLRNFKIPENCMEDVKEATIGTMEMVHLIFGRRRALSTIVRLLVEGTFSGLFSWILSLRLWTVSNRGRMEGSSALTISSLVNPVSATIGPIVIILRGQSWLMRFSILFAWRLLIVIACKAYRCTTHSGEALVLAWGPYDIKDEKSIPRWNDAYFLRLLISKRL